MNLLFYVEPHPIRNSYTEWFHIASVLSPVFLRYAQNEGINYRMISNNFVIDKFVLDYPQMICHLQRPTFTESNFIDAQFMQWNEISIKKWLELVEGEGEITEFYQTILARIHSELPIDIIFTWSENGALRKFCKKFGIPLIFGELGPTRTPFVKTMYFDRNGTNGNALFRKQARELVELGSSTALQSSESWLIWSDKKNKNPEKSCSVLDISSTFNMQMQNYLPDRKYVYIPLQLADDLNTLMHSKFKTPKDFLVSILPQIAKAGYAIVIKGHPGAATRSYNMRLEIEALQYAEESDFDIITIPSNASSSLSIYVLGNASYTVSINSSVSFESMLLGVPTIVMGAASFDADGWLQEKITLCPVEQQIDYSSVINVITSVYMQKVFVPREIVLSSNYLLELFKGAIEESFIEPICEQVSAHKLDFDFVAHLLMGTTGINIDVFQNLTMIPYIGSNKDIKNSLIKMDNDRLLIKVDNQSLCINLPLRSGVYQGRLDECSILELDDDFVISGWAVENETGRPPIQIIVIDNNMTIVSRHRVNHIRKDVSIAIQNVSTVLCEFKFKLPIGKYKKLSLILVGYNGVAQFIEHIEHGTVFS